MTKRLMQLKAARQNDKLKYGTVILLIILQAVMIPTITRANPGIGRISGTIYDADNREPIPGVTVMMLNRFAGTSSGPDGRFTLKNLSEGVYSLQVSSIGYETVRLDSVIVDGSPSKELSINMT